MVRVFKVGCVACVVHELDSKRLFLFVPVLTRFQADGSFYVCDSEVKAEIKRKDAAAADEGLPSRTWTSTAQIWSDFGKVGKWSEGESVKEWAALGQQRIKIPVLVPKVTTATDAESSSQILDWKVIEADSDSRFNVEFERPCGHAHLINSLGIKIWEGELEEGRPEKPSTTVSHLMADIMSGNNNVTAFIFHLNLQPQMSNYLPILDW
jgi:hypothetical protein